MPKKLKVVPPVPGHHVIELGGKHLVVVYDFQAYALFKQLTQINLLADWNPSSFDAMQAAIFAWAGAYRHQPDTDLDFFMEHLNGSNYPQVMSKLLEAFTAGQPRPSADPLAPISENHSA